MDLDARTAGGCWASALQRRLSASSANTCAEQAFREAERKAQVWCNDLEARQVELQDALAASDCKRAAFIKAQKVDTISGALRALAAEWGIDLSAALLGRQGCSRIAAEEPNRGLEPESESTCAPGWRASPQETGTEVLVRCSLPVPAHVATLVGSSLKRADFALCRTKTYVHASCRLTVELGDKLDIYVGGIEADDVIEWAKLQLEGAPASFGIRLLEWVTAQRAAVPGFVDTGVTAPSLVAEGHVASVPVVDFLPSARDLLVDTSRVLLIYTWGRALRLVPPPDSQFNFNACVLNGRGGAARLRYDNGLSDVAQHNVASCSLFPYWLRTVTSKIESSSFKVVSITCTKGRHRSVAAAEILRRLYYPAATVQHLTIY